MNVQEHLHSNAVVLQPLERLTVETAAQFRAAVRRQLAEGRTRLVLDLAHVPYIDSCGLGAIAGALVSARTLGGGLKLVHLTGRNRQLFEITRLTSVLDVFDTEEAAVQAFAPQAQLTGAC